MKRINRFLLLWLLILVSLNLYGANFKPYGTNIDLKKMPFYSGYAQVRVNNNQPYFNTGIPKGYEYYSNLDSLGRCGYALANIGFETMPTEKRGSIGMVKPTGWQTIKYDFIDGKYLFNRCHLIGYQLSGENANVKNLITGTRYLNVDLMLPYENFIADYIKRTNRHVYYRVTPNFYNNELIARGVLLEAKSVEDGGQGVNFCVYLYNIQPMVAINYSSGNSSVQGALPSPKNNQNYNSGNSNNNFKCVINTKTKKIHRPTCRYANSSNVKDTDYDKNTLIQNGYVPCKVCKP